LWHWPLLAFIRVAAEDQPSKAVQLFLIAIGIILAWLTFVLVERPIRFGKAKSSVLVLCIAMLSIGVLGLFTVKPGGFPSLRSQIDDKPDLDVEYRSNTCFLDRRQDPTEFRAECSDTKRPLVLLWGDSHAASIYPGLRNLSKSISFGLSQFTASGCPPLLQ